MGGVLIEQADDAASSLFYNPAGIGKIRGFQFEPLNVQLQLDDGFVGALGTDSIKFPTFADYKASISANPGAYQGASLGVIPTIAFRGFALGVLYHQSAAGILEDDGTFTVRGHRELVPAAGFAFRLASGIVRVGYSVQYISKTEGEESGIDSASTRDWHEGFAEGAGLSHNAGVALTLPWNYSPSLNLVARNIGGLKFTGSPLMALATDSSGTPLDVPATYDLAYGMHFKLGGGGAIHVATEYRDITSASGAALLSRLALGLEVDIAAKLLLRGGVGAGRPSFGAGIRGKMSEWSLTRYTEDWGPGFLESGDSRWVLEFKARLF
jgi:hypothetical protein